MEREQQQESSRQKSSPEEAMAATATPFKRKPYRGVRMRKWGKWVAEVREPKKRSRLWLGSYKTAVAAARAYDTAVFYLHGSSARVNFPDLLSEDDDIRSAATVDMSAALIREKAVEVGSRVDALLTASADSDKTELNQKPESGGT